jgi:hypothetical protein
MLWAFLSHGNLSLISENFKLVSQRKVNPLRFPNSHYRGAALESEGVKMQRGSNFGNRNGELVARLEGSSDQSVLDCNLQTK